MTEFIAISSSIKSLVAEWSQKFISMPVEVLTERKNIQQRTIKQIVGHMVDSASNNTHRVIHLQYRESPLEFPNYASYGNNDRWIAIQKYQEEDWETLVNLWKYSHLHFCHVISNVNPQKINHVWMADVNNPVTLKDMVDDFPRHFNLHISEIEALLADS